MCPFISVLLADFTAKFKITKRKKLVKRHETKESKRNLAADNTHSCTGSVEKVGAIFLLYLLFKNVFFRFTQSMWSPLTFGNIM